MLTYPNIDPVIFSLGPLQVRWYGLMYILGFIATYLLVKHQARRFQWTQLLTHLDNLNLALLEKKRALVRDYLLLHRAILYHNKIYHGSNRLFP